MKTSEEGLREYARGWRFWLDRARGYGVWLQAVILLDLWRRGAAFSVWCVVVGGFVGILVLLILDHKWIYPKEAAAIFRANPEWMELRKDVDEIKRRLT